VINDKKEPGWMKKICRTCGHNKYWHQTAKSSYGTPGGWCANYECGESVAHMPYCREFVPEDNLDYVEWLAEKRNLI
jgi:hypothetical protein